MSPSVMTPEPSPRRPDRLRAATEQPPVVARRPELTRTPTPPLARPRQIAVSAVSPHRRRPRRMPRALAILLDLLTVAVSAGGGFMALLLMGQEAVIAWLVVGAVLVVVFGTPLLCLAGWLGWYVRALTRAGRRRSCPPPPCPAPAAQAQSMIVGEVVVDD